jgi:hypothetical protein
MLPLTFTWFNGFWLLVPILLWNGVLGPRLKNPIFTSDEFIPKPLFWLENGLRVLTFALPFFLACRLPDSTWGAVALGWWLYGGGTLIYFLSWIPHLKAWAGANHPILLLAPAYTPLLWLGGMSLILGAWGYMWVAVLFDVSHVAHIALNVRRLGKTTTP